MENILRCPSCVPRYRVVRPDGQRLGWVPEVPYVGFLVLDRRYDAKKPPRDCPVCGASLVKVETKGQAIVEFALVVPIMLFILYGVIEMFWLSYVSSAWQRGVDVLADAAAVRVATRPGESWNSGWNELVNSERTKTRGCGTATVTFPDAGQDAGDRVTVSWVCNHRALTGVIPDISTTVDSTSVIPLTAPSPTPSPSPSPSPS